MFDDAKKALDALQSELLAEEEAQEPSPEDDLLEEDGEDLAEEEKPMVYSNYSNQYGKNLRNYASGYRAYNGDSTDRDLEEFSEEVRQPEKSQGILGPALTALALLIAIAVVLAWGLCRLGWLG